VKHRRKRTKKCNKKIQIERKGVQKSKERKKIGRAQNKIERARKKKIGRAHNKTEEQSKIWKRNDTLWAIVYGTNPILLIILLKKTSTTIPYSSN